MTPTAKISRVLRASAGFPFQNKVTSPASARRNSTLHKPTLISSGKNHHCQVDTQLGVVGILHLEQHHAGMPYSKRASVEEFWPIYGDSHVAAALFFAASKDEFKMNSQYFVFRLNFIIHWISKNEAECMFSLLKSAFIKRPESKIVKAQCFSLFVRKIKYVNRVI